jgi:hypothetical protein
VRHPGPAGLPLRRQDAVFARRTGRKSLVHRERSQSNRRGRHNDRQVSEFATPTPAAGPFDITVGPDNNLWFAETTPTKSPNSW